ncbi:MAG TPA: FAD-dependent monooxygenase [Solirubrobacteraceae bacterium]|nr:FAD-dependent monooxygenase [Solirubrobacteraceae bacterium]
MRPERPRAGARSRSDPDATQVLIAGGGPVGLAAAIELVRRGIDCLVIEPRRAVSHARPRCKTINVRTMEHLRRWGIADRLRRRAPVPVSWSQDVVFCTSLTGHELWRFTGVLGLQAEGDRFCELGQQAPQYVLEELLREVLAELAPGSLISGRRVVGLEQDDREARVSTAGPDGTEDLQTITADYVVGCDGPRSTVREAIGSAYVGERALKPNFGMVFRAPALLELCAHGRAVQYWVVNRAAPALLGPIDLIGTWWMIALDVAREEGERRARELIDTAVGAPVSATILSTDPWTARMQIVDRLRDRRVFLAGDAAHLNPPFGGHGLNTGIGDAVDLGWKLAAVLDGWGGTHLLDSYEAERRPVQTAVIEAAVANMRVLSTDLVADALDAPGEQGERARRAVASTIRATKRAEFHALDLVLDLGYERSPIIAPSAGQAGLAGFRLPHLWIGPGRSLFDELGPAMTLLVLADGLEADASRIAAAARDAGMPLRTLQLPGPARSRYGSALVLVRPDQHVAWCGDGAPEDPRALVDLVRGASITDHLSSGATSADPR